EMLVREKREHLIQGLFDFLPHRIELDIYGYEDIFDHK
ncbi:MAG: ribonuclease D, partial [Spirochaetia bacterium]|nr:ribonuclease D [Spirochaetia bacterium]